MHMLTYDVWPIWLLLVTFTHDTKTSTAGAQCIYTTTTYCRLPLNDFLFVVLQRMDLDLISLYVLSLWPIFQDQWTYFIFEFVLITNVQTVTQSPLVTSFPCHNSCCQCMSLKTHCEHINSAHTHTTSMSTTGGPHHYTRGAHISSPPSLALHSHPWRQG